MTTASRRPFGFLSALPSYLGGKRKLLGRIFRSMPRPPEAPVLVDAFLGGGSVSLWAKRRGYRVVCNDVAERSMIVGRALVENDRATLSSEDVTRLFVPAESPTASPGFIERVYGGDVLPTRHARFLDGAFEAARSTAGVKHDLLLLLLLRYVIWLRPLGNWGAKTIVQQMDEGRWEDINTAFLRDHLVQRIECHPKDICERLRKRINAGVFSNGLRNECSQLDVFGFLAEVEADVLYADPPYAQTSSYESALRPLDSILAGHPVDSVPSIFSGPRGIEALDRLLDACRHIPHLVLSYGNAALSPEELAHMVERHRHDVHVEAIAHAHLASLASEDSKRRNLEVLVRAGRGR